MKKLTVTKREIFADYIPMAATALCILYFAIVRQQPFIQAFPLLVSLYVQYLTAHANRWSFVIGGTNAIVYAIGFMMLRTYFSAIQSVLISAPLQYVSFFLWKKNAKAGDKISSRLRFLSLPWQATCVLGTVALWLSLYFVFTPLFADASFPLMDSFVFAMGVISPILSAFRFVEAQYYSCIGQVVYTLMWVVMAFAEPASINYVIIAVYGLYRIAQAIVTWTRLYMQQKGEDTDSAESFENICIKEKA